VPYSVSATIIADLIGGRIHAAFVPAAFILPMLEDHRLAGLAVSAREPISAPVSVPTAISQGIGYEYETWYGILAPARTPKPILHLLHEAISALAGEPELLAKIRAQGIDPKDIGLADFDAYTRWSVSLHSCGRSPQRDSAPVAKHGCLLKAVDGATASLAAPRGPGARLFMGPASVAIAAGHFWKPLVFP
jgi:hypothetical protein